jgi:hypothetical protein
VRLWVAVVIEDGVGGLAERDLAFNGVQKADELPWLQLRNCRLRQSSSRADLIVLVQTTHKSRRFDAFGLTNKSRSVIWTY